MQLRNDESPRRAPHIVDLPRSSQWSRWVFVLSRGGGTQYKALESASMAERRPSGNAITATLQYLSKNTHRGCGGRQGHTEKPQQGTALCCDVTLGTLMGSVLNLQYCIQVELMRKSLSGENNSQKFSDPDLHRTKSPI